MVSWDLLHLLNDEWQKTYAIQYLLRTKFDTEVEDQHLKKIIYKLKRAGIVETKNGAGVRRSMRNIVTLDEVMRALGTRIRRVRGNGPGAGIARRISDLLDRVEFMNNVVLHKKVNNEF